MDLIVKLSDGVPVTTTSAIADGTETQHKNVLELVRTYITDFEEFGRVAFETQPFETAGGEQTREVGVLNEEQATLLLTYMRNSDVVRAFKKRLVKDFWEAKRAGIQKFDPESLTRMDILKLAIDSEEGRIKAVAERDHAIATKSQIGSKREATAMATASVAKREVARLLDRLGTNTRHATVKAVEKATGKSFFWAPLRKWCEVNGVVAEDVPDPLYGSVKSWPADAWGEIYGIDLHALFAEKAGAVYP